VTDVRCGVVEARVQGRRFIFIRPTDRGFEHPVFCHLSRCQLLNGHDCLYTPEAPVLFKIDMSGKSFCFDVELDQSRCEVDLPEIEESEIIDWKSTFGFARRDCGCTLYVNCRAFQVEPWDNMVGTRIRHSVVTTPDGKCFATQVRLIPN
jgi:hypothetical protein